MLFFKPFNNNIKQKNSDSMAQRKTQIVITAFKQWAAALNPKAIIKKKLITCKSMGSWALPEIE